MSSTGIVRQIDELGRIVIPKETRTLLGIHNRDSLAIFVDSENMVLSKYQPGCVFCQSMDDVTPFRGHPVCSACKAELQTI
ncbi:AbrB/MazE/SpoVT family DNA-binding domain-containing protein [Alicyclobacillus tolerans]|uniref:AbrB/MazE/SpoVT family DNA-binding domain-containing protein n=1 Tax=Alicyclobacillus tolerans TaxID=90970 RepID=UPI003B7DAF54